MWRELHVPEKYKEDHGKTTQYHQYLSQFLTDLLANIYRRGINFSRRSNEWQQPHVLTKTTPYHQYLGQFLTDLLATFTKGG